MHVVIESPMLIVGDDQHAVFPMRRGSNRFINILDKRLAACNVIFWVLRITTNKVRCGMIIRLDKGIGRGVARVLYMAFEVLKVPKMPFGKAHSHTAYGQRLLELVAFIDGPTE